MSETVKFLRAREHDKAREASYGSTARVLHWLVAALIAAQTVIGWVMPEIENNTPQEGLVSLHLSVGTALMLIVVLRLIWRATHPVPPASILTNWERLVSAATHTALYVLLLIIPALGWAAAGYFGYTVRLFGALTLPAISDPKAEWAHVAGDIHGVLVNILVGLIALHVTAALYHYFLRQDDVMQRMLRGI